MSFVVSKLKRMLHRLVLVYTCQNTTLLEITCHGSIMMISFNSFLVLDHFECITVVKISMIFFSEPKSLAGSKVVFVIGKFVYCCYFLLYMLDIIPLNCQSQQKSSTFTFVVCCNVGQIV